MTVALILVVVVAIAGIGVVLVRWRPRHHPDRLVLGLVRRTPYTVPARTLLRHLFVPGPTGSGKSVLLTSLCHEVAALPSQWSLVVIDVKDGALCSDIIETLPPHRLADCLLITAADPAFPPSLNFLAGIRPERRSLAASEFLSCYRRLFDTSSAPRLEYILLMATLLICQLPGATMLDILRLLRDRPYRAWAAAQVHSNVMVRQFWEAGGEYDDIVGKHASTANVQSIINKIGGLLALPEVRNLLGQPEHKLDIRQCIDTGKILLFDFSKGVIGELASAFLAAITATQVQLAAQSRADTPAVSRHPTVLVVDEFQNFAVSSFETALSEGRSEGLGIVAACQFERQLSTPLRLTIEANCAYKLQCQRREDQRTGKATHHVLITPLQEPDAQLRTVDALALPPLPRRNPANLQLVRDQSRRLLARPRAEVEADIARRMNQIPQPKEHCLDHNPCPTAEPPLFEEP
ncbi:MAG TPA: hypothetical protein VKQ30_25880 [Ktedonobacterales bacterium]|nr:hypothetical protein [Ktedonobacterales bacterium]